MERKITAEQIQTVLQTIYQTNMPVAQFGALKKLLLELPTIEEVKEKK